VSNNPTIKLDLVDADTRMEIDDLRLATSRSFKPEFNGAGTFTLSLPISSDAARQVRKRKHELIFFRNKKPVWSGFVSNIKHTARDERTDVTFTGWLDELNSRFVRKSEEASLIFVGVVGGSILQTLVTTMNAQTDSNGVVRPTRVSFGGYTDTQVRTRSYKVGDSYGAQAREMMIIENGYDVAIDDPISRRIVTRDPADFVVRSNVHYGYGVDPHNLDDIVLESDGASVHNRINVVDSNGIVYVADDQVAIEAAGVMVESWVSISDVADPLTAAAYANAELVYQRYGNTVYTITPSSIGDVPRPYDDFNWGDQLFLSADVGALQVEAQGVRAFSATLNYTDLGDEIISDLTVASPVS
jgi:hypothetical protein